LGATGVVGSGACQVLLEAGARVVVVARTEDKLKDLLSRFDMHRTNLVGVVGNLDTRAQIEEIRSVVRAALQGNPVDHVISTIGFVSLTPDGISTGDVNVLRSCFEDSLFPTILCAQVFLQDIRDKEGATYTIVSGGFAHKCYYPRAWVGTIKNAAMNGVVESLCSDLANAKVRINGNCLHYGIGRPGEDRNNLGAEAESSNTDFARTFLKIIERKDLRGAIICQDSRADTERFLQA
jgi:NAD(P)-dependent dehydrogenase (short-subunit alcohol dehydrogenase family)